MKFLTGTVAHQLDAKNRIRIPAKFRNAFPEGEKLYYVEYNPGRVAVMPESVLGIRMGVFNDITPDDEEAMDAMARILGSVEEVAEDPQGRTQIPRTFRDHAEIAKEVVSVGMGNFIEIWAQHVYEQRIGGMEIRKANAIAYGKREKV